MTPAEIEREARRIAAEADGTKLPTSTAADYLCPSTAHATIRNSCMDFDYRDYCLYNRDGYIPDWCIHVALKI
jgi:hypothetical protein